MNQTQKSVIIYSTPTCPYCVLAKNFFKKNGVPFKDVDVSVDEKAAGEMIEKSQQMGVPVIDIGGSIVIGYRPDVFTELLAKQHRVIESDLRVLRQQFSNRQNKNYDQQRVYQIAAKVKTEAKQPERENEASIGQVYYNNVPLISDEATGPRQQPYVSGVAIVINGGYQLAHSTTLQGLQPNTTYYFLTRAVDSAGNMSMTWPSSFRTSN